MEHSGLLHDTSFWVLLSTLLFLVIAFKKGRAPITGLLDGRTARIKAELEEAERLRVEAQDLLSETQKKHRDALHTAQKIVEGAKETAERIEKDALVRLEETNKRRETQLMDRIARAEAAAIAELRNQAADIATRTAEQLLRDAANKNGARLANEAIEDIGKRMHG